MNPRELDEPSRTQLKSEPRGWFCTRCQYSDDASWTKSSPSIILLTDELHPSWWVEEKNLASGEREKNEVKTLYQLWACHSSPSANVAELVHLATSGTRTTGGSHSPDGTGVSENPAATKVQDYVTNSEQKQLIAKWLCPIWQVQIEIMRNDGGVYHTFFGMAKKSCFC
jgi:hypothetical protein